jgi:hypothetical protein
MLGQKVPAIGFAGIIIVAPTNKPKFQFASLAESEFPGGMAGTPMTTRFAKINSPYRLMTPT